MKVLVISSWFPTARNPVQGVFVWEQVRIASRRFDVAVIAPTLLTLRSLSSRERRSPPALGSIPIVRPRVISPVPGRPAWVAGLYARAVRTAYSELASTWGKPDVIHAHVALNAGYAAVRLGSELHVPVVLTEHATSGSTWLKAFPGSGMLRSTLESIPYHVAVSPALAARIRSVATVDPRVIGNVVDTEFFAPTFEPRVPGPTHFASVGGLIPRKGFDDLIRATAAGGSDWEVKIAGRGPERSSLERLALELGIDKRVELLGEVSLAGVRDLYRWADFAVLPSAEETFGVAAAEAMAMGRPVIGYANEGFKFVVDGFGFGLVPIGDVPALTNVMERASRGLLDADSTVIRQSIVDRFGPSAFLDQLSELYTQAVTRIV